MNDEHWRHPKRNDPMPIRSYDMPDAPLFTVFTPTYNRAHTLRRVFDSLRAQTPRDFEWLVIDDASTDGTRELLAEWAATADFPVRYLRQDHAGKHIAYNLAVREARGLFFVTLDSDDACVSYTLERIAYHWNNIPKADRAHFCGVAGLSRNQHGEIVGDRFPAGPFDVNLRDQKYVYRLRGEKCGMMLTTVYRQFPFPEISGTQFVPEGVVWLDIAKTYKVRGINEVFRIYYVDDTKTGASLTKRKSLSDGAPGRLHYYVWLLNNDLQYFFRSPTPFLKGGGDVADRRMVFGKVLPKCFGPVRKAFG